PRADGAGGLSSGTIGRVFVVAGRPVSTRALADCRPDDADRKRLSVLDWRTPVKKSRAGSARGGALAPDCRQCGRGGGHQTGRQGRIDPREFEQDADAPALSHPANSRTRAARETEQTARPLGTGSSPSEVANPHQ